MLLDKYYRMWGDQFRQKLVQGIIYHLDLLLLNISMCWLEKQDFPPVPYIVLILKKHFSFR